MNMASNIEAMDREADALRPHYRRFLEHQGSRILLTAHSHQCWPDVSRDAQLECWDDAARWVDNKWGRVFEVIVPEFQRGVAARLGTQRWQDLAIAPNTHELLSRLVSCFPKDARVLTTDSEFHSLRRQLDRHAEDGMSVHWVPVEAPDFAARFIAAAEQQRPAWAALSQVFFTNSRVVHELPKILTALDALRIPVLVDVYHGFGALPLEVDTWPGAVFVTGGGYKYLQAGEGAAWMLLPAQTSFRPANTGWFADFAHLEERGGVQYGPGGSRFAGATFDPSGLYRARAVMRWMDTMGLDAAELRRRSLARTQLIIELHTQHRLADRGWALATPFEAEQRGGFVSLRHPDARVVCRRLLDEGVMTDARGDLLRLGPAPYTRGSEILRAMEILAALLG